MKKLKAVKGGFVGQYEEELGYTPIENVDDELVTVQQSVDEDRYTIPSPEECGFTSPNREPVGGLKGEKMKTRQQLFKEIVQKAKDGQDFESDQKDLDKILCQEYLNELTEDQMKRIGKVFREEQNDPDFFDEIEGEEFDIFTACIACNYVHNDPMLIVVDQDDVFQAEFNDKNFSPDDYCPEILLGTYPLCWAKDEEK